MHIDFTYSETDIRERAALDGKTHISTGVAVVRDGKILMARRAAGDYLGGVYELPGGGVDDGETILEGAIREVGEELGLRVTTVLGMFDGFDYSTDRKPGVRQINFLVKAEPGEPKLNPAEHDDYVWADEETLAKIESTEPMRICMKKAFELLKQCG
jgi:8-oxo-dGTP diphosphatase